MVHKAYQQFPLEYHSRYPGIESEFYRQVSLHETADVGHTYNRQERLWHL